MKIKPQYIFSIILFVIFVGMLGFWFRHHVADIFRFLFPNQMMKRTVDDVLAEIGNDVKKRFLPQFEKAQVSYPPSHLTLVGFKAEKRLEVWGKKQGKWVFLWHYPILAASGIAGPKLREGDRQVPEGLYQLNFLNPNSRYHLSMQINYPNTFDRHKAALEQRTNLGGEIFIHGKAVSIGCLAIGDEAIEELFVLVATIGMDNVTVIIAPQQNMQNIQLIDLKRPVRPWISELYVAIQQALEPFQHP
jgi:murein L,D-transpeptidase YafK